MCCILAPRVCASVIPTLYNQTRQLDKSQFFFSTRILPCLPPATFFADRDTVWWLNQVFLAVFILEASLRLYFLGAKRALSQRWVQFDLIIITIGIVDQWIVPQFETDGGVAFISVLRVLRLFRLLKLIRLVSFFQELWLLVFGMIQTAQTIFWTVVFLGLLLYLGGVYLTQTIGDRFPWDNSYNSLSASMYSLMRFVTLDGFSALMRDIYQGKEMGVQIIFFMGFLLVTAFGLVNLIISRAVQTIHQASKIQEAVNFMESMTVITDAAQQTRRDLRGAWKAEEISRLC